ncbi:MAG: Fic family protein [Pseudomonadota bacterium]
MTPRRTTGTYVTTSTVGEEVRAFVPSPLPPEPPLEMTLDLLDLLERANRSLGRVDGLAEALPEVSHLLYMYVRKEAVLSSQIEGTQSSLADLLLYESELVPGVPLDDVLEVSLYVAAVEHGLKRMAEGFPLSLRLLREIHAVLLQRGRGSAFTPGDFRTSQNWIGGARPGDARFVPPPPERLVECLGALELFLHDKPVRMPLLLKAAMAHVQFETIHPFLDGNGRMGRLLITLLLCAERALSLSQPILYLSLYFKTHQQEYYDRLDKVRTEGDWEGWVRFFLEGVRETSNGVVTTARAIQTLFQEDEARILQLGRRSASVLRVYRKLQQKPVASIPETHQALDLSFPTVSKAFRELENLGIAREITGKERDRAYAYDQYLKALAAGTTG